MLFESQHSLREGEFQITSSKSITFPIHIHRSFEYFEQVVGITEVSVGGQKYTLHAGDAVLVFPMQPHSYLSLEEGRMRMCIFSPDLVTSFYKAHGGRVPTSNQFRCKTPETVELATVFHKKSLAYYICGEFERDRAYAEASVGQDQRLLVELLVYADRNFTNRCLLRDAAAEIGYDYAYVSRAFKRLVGISFRQYVNGLRITECKRLLRSTGESMETIGEACGFCSLRAFDREFRAQTGMPPSDYRRSRGGDG